MPKFYGKTYRGCARIVWVYGKMSVVEKLPATFRSQSTKSKRKITKDR